VLVLGVGVLAGFVLLTGAFFVVGFVVFGVVLGGVLVGALWEGGWRWGMEWVSGEVERCVRGM